MKALGLLWDLKKWDLQGFYRTSKMNDPWGVHKHQNWNTLGFMKCQTILLRGFGFTLKWDPLQYRYTLIQHGQPVLSPLITGSHLPVSHVLFLHFLQADTNSLCWHPVGGQHTVFEMAYVCVQNFETGCV